MINIAICDDDSEFLASFYKQLTTILNKLHIEFKCSIMHKISNLYDELLDGVYFDIIFLDIEFFLEDRTGIDLSRYLRDSLRIDSTSLIFISSKSCYAMKLFESQPLDFLVKPIDDLKLERTVIRFIRINNVMTSFFSFSYYGRDIKLPLSSILYFQSFNHKIHIQCTESTNYQYSDKLSHVFDKVKNENFFSPHKSFVANYYAVKKWGTNEIILIDDTVIPISRSHKQNVFRIQLENEVPL